MAVEGFALKGQKDRTTCLRAIQRTYHAKIMENDILRTSPIPLDLASVRIALNMLNKETFKNGKDERDEVILYSYWRSSCSWRVRIALALKNVDYAYVPIHLVKNEQMSDSYTSLNSSEEVPTLKIDGLVLNQSLSIIEYLDETRSGGVTLLPKDPATRAKVRQISDMVAQAIQPIQNLRVLRKIMSWYDDDAMKQKRKVEWGRHWIAHGFAALEKVLTATAGKYCVGDRVTMADLCLVPQVYNANRFKVDMDKFPTINRVHSNLVVLEAFKKAHPDAQPDAQ